MLEPLSCGVDVSKWQGVIDWQKFAAAGVRFAIVKVTEGTGHLDPTAAANVAGARAAGIAVSVYHYAHPNLPAAAQIAFFVEQTKAITPALDFAPAWDVEVNNRRTREQVTIHTLDALDMLAAAWGVLPLLYTSPGFLDAYMLPHLAERRLASFPLWQAHYTSAWPMLCRPWATPAVWQHTSRGLLPGCTANVDLNRLMVPELINQPIKR